jgi:putative YphP/YqiW family bacilliredoxin
MSSALLEQPTYDPVAVQPLRNELNLVGFRDLLTAEAVDEALAASGTTLVMLNSVCGCSAGTARPGVCAALQNGRIPDRLVTLFAGQEKAAVGHLRTKYFAGFAPSSPNIALFNDGKLIALMERHHIQQMAAEQIDAALRPIFDKVCDRQGPSIPREQYEALEYTISCGSTMPRNDGNAGSC